MSEDSSDNSSQSDKKDKRFFQYKIASEMAEKTENKKSDSKKKD